MLYEVITAIVSGNLSASDIDYINAHGTGTPNNDASEGAAIQNVFEGNIPPVSSTKSFTGHTTSAAGGIEAVISILMMEEKIIPPNLNFENQMDRITSYNVCYTKLLRVGRNK